MDEEGPPPEAEPAPPRDEIRIRDLTGRPTACSVCGQPKPVYVEIEVDGVVEYTCRDCYEGDVVELVACRKCGAALEATDAFCGKCGAPRVLACRACGASLTDGDAFCGKCGASVT